MSVASLANSRPFILPFGGVSPTFSTEPLCADGASILGRVTIGARATLGPRAVVRADGHFVRIGDDVCLGAMSTVHIAHDVYPCIIGSRVTVGRNACVHACTVGNDIVIEDDVVILDGAVVEDNVVLEAGSTVFPRKKLAGGFVYAGSPAKPVRELDGQELSSRAARVRGALAESWLSEPTPAVTGQPEGFDQAFVAGTATLRGDIVLGPQVGILFSCDLDAGPARITIGPRTNVQDNTRIVCTADGLTIGPDTTVGHNVLIHDGSIGAHSLIGIGAVLSAGTRVDDHVLVAAGAVTEPGQHLEGGWLWGGRPARQLSRLEESRRAGIRQIIVHYCNYGAAYREEQKKLAG